MGRAEQPETCCDPEIRRASGSWFRAWLDLSLARVYRGALMRNVYIPSKVPGFTGVRAIERAGSPKPFFAQVQEAPGRWRNVGKAATQAAAEAIARGYRIDHRGARTRIHERHLPGGFKYIAV